MFKEVCKNIILLLIVPIAFLQYSCKRDCEYTPVSNAGVRFYTISNNKPVVKSIDSIFVYPIGLEDSVLYRWTKNVSSIRLPLNPFEDHTFFVIKLNDNTDTLQVFYKRQLYFVSEECGFSMNFVLNSVHSTANKIDSVLLIQPKVQTINEEHIRIYF